MKLKLVGILSLGLLFAVPSAAQMDNENQKNLKKASKLMKKRRYEESASYIKDVLQDYPLNDKLWKYYQDVWFSNYRDNYKPELGLKIESENDSLQILLQQAVKYVLEKPKWDYLNAVNDAATYSAYNAESASVLRNYYVDRKLVKNLVNEKSRGYFDKAEGEFTAKNYEKAIGYYEKAIAEDSSNYKAVLYLGDTYYAMEYYGKAADYFRKANEMSPRSLEPMKYLADALSKKEEFEQALEVIKKSFYIYPDEGMYIKLYDVLEKIGNQKLDRNWILKRAKTITVFNESRRQNFFDDISYFKYYEDAGKEVLVNYDSSGILKSNEKERLDLDNYLEVHCFREMLKNTKREDTPELTFARKMDEEGMLTPYLLINLYTVDLYPQYRHFVDNNKSTIERYINDYLIVNVADKQD